MTDQPKPITPEFVRGFHAARGELLEASKGPEVGTLSSAAYSAAYDYLTEKSWRMSASPLATAKERLGAFLVERTEETCESPCVQMFHNIDGSWSLHITWRRPWPQLNVTCYGKGADRAEAINAALDAAERSEKP